MLVLLVPTIGACSIENSLAAPNCIDGDTALLGAQSVPTAQLVPCFHQLPDGWEADHVRIDQDGTVVRFHSDRAGDDAAVFHYTDTCDIGEAVNTRSEHADVDRYDHIEQVDPRFVAQRYYLFEGGCVWWEFDFDEGAAAAQSIALGERLTMVPRDEVNDTIRETFLDEQL